MNKPPSIRSTRKYILWLICTWFLVYSGAAEVDNQLSSLHGLTGGGGGSSELPDKFSEPCHYQNKFKIIV